MPMKGRYDKMRSLCKLDLYIYIYGSIKSCANIFKCFFFVVAVEC